jgi:PAS domain S-box-containing protein
VNLRSKLLLGIGIALIVTFTLVALFSYISMVQSFRTLEDQEVQRAVESTVSLLNADIKHTYSIGRDYAVWSETYRFVQGENPGWIDQNMGDDFFTRFLINYVLVYNTSNQFVYGKGYNVSSKADVPVPVSLLRDAHFLNSVGGSSPATGTSGIIDTPDGLFIIASHPVLRDNFEGSPAGSLQIVRSVDSLYLADLDERTGFKVTLIPSVDLMGNQSLAGVASLITPDSPVAIIPENEDTVAGFMHIEDLQNTGGLYVKVTEPRSIYHTGVRTIATFLTGLLGAGIFIIVFVLLFIDRVILSRLNAIIRTVREKKDNGENSRADGDTRKDELARLALEIDPVFNRLAESRTELEESEERYRTLIDQLPDYIIVHRDGILLFVNPSAAANLGYDMKSLLGTSIFNLIAPDSHEVIRQAVVRRMQGEEVPRYEIRIIARDGTYHTTLVHGARIHYDGALASLNVLTDITERKKTEEALRENEEKYRVLAENATDIIWTLDLATQKFTYFSPSVEKIRGFTSEEAVKIPLEKTLTLESYTRAIAELKEGMEPDRNLQVVPGRVHIFEFQEYCKDGSVISTETRMKFIRNTEGIPTSIQGITRDITERKQAEEALRASRQLFSDIISFLPDPTFVIDNDGKVLAWNRALEQLSGVPAGAIIGKGNYEYSLWLFGKRRPILIDLVLHPDLDASRLNYSGIVSDGHTVTAQVEITRPGSMQRVSLSFITSPLIDPQGNIAGAIESIRDISRLREVEAELALINQDLERIVRDRTQALEDEVVVRKQAEAAIRASLDEKVILLREVHHRVKNNLQIIISLTNLQMRQTTDPGVKLLMSETQNRVRAMSLVHEKLYRSESLSRIDFADYTRFLATQLFSFFGVDTMKVRLELKMGKIMVDINTAVPLGLLMNELISNALKHAFPEGREGTIMVSGSEDNDLITLVVMDNGIGIPADFDWKITTSLGMRLVTNLVDQLNGTIERCSGEGTIFRIRIQKNSAPE